MHRGKSIITAVGIGLLVGFGVAGAEEGRYVERDGVRYWETRRVERRPETETRWEAREETVYAPQYTTEMRDSYRTVLTPVVEYQMEPRVHGWWNPLAPSYVAYHMKPVTRWEQRVEKVRTPVTYRDVVPEKRVVHVPVRSLRIVEEEKITRVAVSPEPARQLDRPPTATAQRIGGISQLDNDPPRIPSEAIRR